MSKKRGYKIERDSYIVVLQFKFDCNGTLICSDDRSFDGVSIVIDKDFAENQAFFRWISQRDIFTCVGSGKENTAHDAVEAAIKSLLGAGLNIDNLPMNGRPTLQLILQDYDYGDWRDLDVITLDISQYEYATGLGKAWANTDNNINSDEFIKKYNEQKKEAESLMALVNTTQKNANDLIF